MEDLAIGAEIILKVVESETEECNGCFFEDNPVCIKFACCEGVRSDGKSVIFKEVKE